MNKQYWKLCIKTLLTTASFITLEAPHLSYAMDLPGDIISEQEHKFIDALQKTHPHFIKHPNPEHDSKRYEIMKGISEKKLVLDRLNSLPNEVGNVTNLETLSIKGNLTALPATIGNLKNLKTLSIQSQHLTNLPETIGNLKNLETLTIDFSGLTNLPESIGELQALKKLDLSNNKNLTNLPKGIERLKNKKLNILLYGTPLEKSFGAILTLEEFLEMRKTIRVGTLVTAALDPNSNNDPKTLKDSALGSLPKELRQHILTDMAAASAQDKNPQRPARGGAVKQEPVPKN